MKDESKDKLHAKELSDVLIVVIRVRGKCHKHHDVKKTFALLRLFRKNHAVILRATESINGMLFKIKDHAAYGIINRDTLIEMLKKKARLAGHKPLDEASLKALTGYKTHEELADALLKFEIKFQDIKHIVPVFRLHPPKGGFYNGIKHQYPQGGALGFHGNEINDLLIRMV